MAAWTLAFGCGGGASRALDAGGPAADASGPISPDGRLDLLGTGVVPRAISYSGYRRGQRPGGPDPSYEQVAEDMHLLARHYDLIRVYGTGSHTETILEVLRGEELDIKMMLGAWLASEPDARAANQTQIAESIELANQYSDIIVAVSVGNEILVDWSDHRIEDVDVVIDYVREVKAGVRQPVTVADNFAAWRTSAGRRLAAELDFVTMHTYAQWEGYPIEDAMARTIENVEQVRAALPDSVIAIGEAGWTTQALGEPMIRGVEAHEYYQKVYRDALVPWLESEGLTCFWFAAFDGPWKGGDNPGEPEKHWGLFTTDRVAKYAIYELYPDRLPPEDERVTGPPEDPGEVEAGPPIEAPRYVIYAETTRADDAVADAPAWRPWESKCDVAEVDDDAAEGEAARRVTPVPTRPPNQGVWWGLGVAPAAHVNLSQFSDGALAFRVKTDYTGSLWIGVQSGTYELGTTVDARIEIGDGSYGYAADGQWHDVAIPVAELRAAAGALNLADVSAAFTLFDDSFGGDPSSATPILFDDIRWLRAMP